MASMAPGAGDTTGILDRNANVWGQPPTGGLPIPPRPPEFGGGTNDLDWMGLQTYEPEGEEWAGAGQSLMTAAGKLAEQQIREGIADYGEYARHAIEVTRDQRIESDRKLQQAKIEGIAAIGEMARQAAYETKTAYMGAELTSSAQEARLGASGVRATGSPLLAAQQVSDVAWGAAGEKARAGVAGITLGGLKLGGSLRDITAAKTLLTSEYQRSVESARRKKVSLIQNAPEMVRAANTGAVIDWTGRLITIGLGLAGL